MNIVFAGNDKVFKGMLLSVLSITKHYKESLHLYILTMELKEIDPDYVAVKNERILLLEKNIQEVNPRSTVTKLDVTDLFLKELKDSPNNDTRYTSYTLLRLLLDLIPGIPDKVLYLDTDVLAHQDISGFYNTELKNIELAGVKDRYGRFFMGPRYLNAGVLLLNMKRIKETGLFRKTRTYLNAKKVFLSDQTAINKFVLKKKIMPRIFNEQKKVTKKTVMRHFSMQFRLFPKFHFINIKPWHKEKLHHVYKCHDFDDILEKYEQLTKETL